jgi:hypothetical protein
MADKKIDGSVEISGDIVGKLPCYTVKEDDKIIDFITNNALNDKCILIRWQNHFLIGSFANAGQNYYSFVFNNLGRNTNGMERWGGAHVDLTDISFYELFGSSNYYRNDFILEKNSPLPYYKVNNTDNVLSFITSNDLQSKAIIIRYNGNDFLGEFEFAGGSNYSFEFKRIGANVRYHSTVIDLTGLTFGNIFSSTYQENYETSIDVDAIDFATADFAAEPIGTQLPNESIESGLSEETATQYMNILKSFIKLGYVIYDGNLLKLLSVTYTGGYSLDANFGYWAANGQIDAACMINVNVTVKEHNYYGFTYEII